MTPVSYNAVPGLMSPGFLSPGDLNVLTPGSGLTTYHYIGHLTLYYLDYIDWLTGKTLACTPGNSYSMFPVSNRAGLSEPPPDGRWGTPSAPAFEIAFDSMFAKARVHSASLHAASARKHYRQFPYRGPALVPEKEATPPSESSVMLANARRRNAELQAERIMRQSEEKVLSG